MPAYAIGGGIAHLIKLKDTPESYSGNAKKALVVNDAEDAVIFDKAMLPLDGTRMMTGDLDMGNHAIADIDILKLYGFDAAINAYADSIVQLSNKAKTAVISLRLAYLDALTGITVGDGYMIQTDEIRARDGDGLKLYEDGGAGIFIKDGGNIGCKISNPATRVNLKGVLGLGENASSFKNTGNAAIELLTDSTFGSVDDGHSGIRMFAYDMNGWTTAKLGIQVSSDWSNYIGGDSPAKSDMAMVIGQTDTIIKGNVGIGQSSPQRRMHITHTGASLIPALVLENKVIDEGGTQGTGLIFTVDGSGYYPKAGIVFTRTGCYGRGKLDFLVDSVADANEVVLADTKMTILSGGNVGIGTNAPGAKLDVNGDAKLGGALDMNNNHINEAALDLGDLDNQEYRGFVLTSQIAGESLSFSNLIYHASDNRYNKADADTLSKTEGDLAIVLTTGTTAENGYVTILKLGSVKDTSWSFTIGAILYVSQTGGAITATEPSAVGTFSRKVGYAQAANIVYFDPSHTVLENG